MYQYLQNVQSYIAPPVAAVFILGIIWKRVNSKGSHNNVNGRFSFVNYKAQFRNLLST